MSHRDRNNRKSGVSESNRHNKYHTNKWKNNHWGRNFNNYGNSNYRNSDYGSGHSDNRYNNWNQPLPNPWDNDWFNNQHPNFTNSHYNANNFNITSGLGVNFSRSNRSKNLKEKTEHRTGERHFTPKPQSDPLTFHPVEKNQKKIAKCPKDPPSTITSASNSQACSSNSIDKVSEANSTTKQHENSAEQVTKKLIHQLTSMNKHNLKQMINNPSSKYETALQTHARNRMRAEMRTKLQSMSSNQEHQLLNNVLETDECVDMDKIPDNVFDEIGRVLDINLLGQEDNSNKKYNDTDDKDKEQIAYPEDLFLRAEKLLMENSILFLEDRLNDSMLNNSDRIEDDRTPIKIKNEIKEEPDDIGDDNFFEIQESGNDNFLLTDLVFEDREGSLSLRNDNFVDQLNEMSDKDEPFAENHQTQNSDENSGEMVRMPTTTTTTTLIVKEENIENEHYKQTTNNNIKDITSNNCSKTSSQSSFKLYKSPDRHRSTQCNNSINTHKDTTDSVPVNSVNFDRTIVTNVKQEFPYEPELTSGSASSVNIVTSNQEPPKRIDLFTKLQNSGAFESASSKRKSDPKEASDYKRDTLFSRKKKKKHKSRSRSISRLRSRSRSQSRSRNSHKSKKSSRERSRKGDTPHYVVNDTVESRSENRVENLELSNESSVIQSEQNDEIGNKTVENVEIVENVETVVGQDDEKTETSGQVNQEISNDELTDPKIIETRLDDEATMCKGESIINTTESVIDNQIESQSDAIVSHQIEQSPLEASATSTEQISGNVDDSNNLEEQHKTAQPTVDTVTNIPPPIEKINDKCESSEHNKAPDTVKQVNEVTGVSEVTGDESSTSVGSNLAETNSATLTSESQSSLPDDISEVVSTKPSISQKNNIVAIRKIVLKPSASRHQKDSSKHKCEKERHTSSSSKIKKSETNVASSKKIDHKDNSSHTMGKQSHHDQPHRVWRSAGEKKCIEPSKSTLRSIDIFDPSRPVEAVKVIETTKGIEPKSSSQRKSQTQTIKSSPTIVLPPPPKADVKKAGSPNKKANTAVTKEKNSLVHRHHLSDSNHSAPLLSDSLKIMTENNIVLQRMKDIDLKLMELQVKKTVIDEQIHNLHKDKNVIDQTTMQLQNERFLLLSSLLTSNAVNAVSQKKKCELAQGKCIEQHKIVELSSDEDVAIVEPKKFIPKVKSHSSHNSKRKIDEDVRTDGSDGTKCKKIKINLNPLKVLANNKNNVRSYDVNEAQSDLKPKELHRTRRCSVRLTRLSSKKIKSLIAKSEVDPIAIDASVSNTRFDGSFSGHRLPIVHLQVIDGFLVAASEDSNLYMHDMLTGKLLGTFVEHTKTVTNFITTENNDLYSVSLDGYLKKFNLKNFNTQLLSINVGEALQVMDYSWDTAFIGSRSGKIYLFDTKADTLADECLCSVGKSIMALKATKEGPRKILIASSRCHNINVRDAVSGLLLRTIEVPDKLTIYSILLDGGQLYCGTNKNLVFRYEFTSGAEISRIKLGTGTICLKSYKNSIILGGCYDGYIYAYDTKNEIQLSRFPGPGKMLLHFDVHENTIIAAAKDKSLCVLELPDDIVSCE